MTSDKNNAIVLLGQYTDAHFDIYQMAGPCSAVRRQRLMNLLTGEKVPVSRCGIHALEARFYEGISADCRRNVERRFTRMCEGVCRSLTDNPVAQIQADKAQSRREEYEKWLLANGYALPQN